MAGQTKVTQSMLADAARTAENTGQGIAENLMRVMNAIEEAHQGFQGSAGSAFQTTSAQLSQELKTLLEALNSMAEAVDASNAQFGSSDTDAQNEITKVASTYSPNMAGNIVSGLRGA